jgi:Zn-dependent protease with chaperone function
LTTSWQATRYDGQTARPQPVSVTLTSEGLRWTADDGNGAQWPYGELRPMQGRWPGQPVRVQHGREALVVADRAFLAALRLACPDTKVKPALGRRAMALGATAALAGTLMASTAYFQWINPTFAWLVAPHVPIAWEEKLGQVLVDRLAPADRRCTDPARLAQVERVLATLSAAQPSPYTYKLIILDSEEVNAFAAPGGFIVVYEAQLKAARTPEELAGVLAHEIQHIHRRHVTRRMIESIGLQAIASTLFGDTSMSTLAWALGFLSYSQALEAEADREGMGLMQTAKLDSQAMIRIFRHDLSDHEEAPSWWDWFSTHPRMEDRVRALEAQGRTARYKPRSIVLTWEWSAVTAGCDVPPPDRSPVRADYWDAEEVEGVEFE